MNKLSFLFILAVLFIVACNSSNTNNQPAATENQEVVIMQDFENAFDGLPNWKGARTVYQVDSTKSHSGIFVCLTNDTMEYSFAYVEKAGNLNSAMPVSADIEGWLNSTVINPKVSLILDVKDSDGKLKAWKTLDVDTTLNETGIWKNFKWTTDLSKLDLKESDELKIFVWNRSKKELMLDDFSIKFKY